ncbi:hypothetical protein L596_013873 [Steinernema carpocapsae]|uniref:TIL domain-containing protein n=1 Tax=Steinernema carpocapsae TaxID=34508 RepID=A0A4U5P266_STECR|nr:hypothetical protein L596_013873 [Steinernema carpocapsae]
MTGAEQVTPVIEPFPTCKQNEVWKNCGSCEGDCGNPTPFCTKECKPPGCYCPLEKKYVRSPKKDCIPLSKCKNNCPANTTWMDCGTCEGTCYDKTRVCTKECKPPRCYCPAAKGYVRFGYAGACILAKDCPGR